MFSALCSSIVCIDGWWCSSWRGGTIDGRGRKPLYVRKIAMHWLALQDRYPMGLYLAIHTPWSISKHSPDTLENWKAAIWGSNVRAILVRVLYSQQDTLIHLIGWSIAIPYQVFPSFHSTPSTYISPCRYTWNPPTPRSQVDTRNTTG